MTNQVHDYEDPEYSNVKFLAGEQHNLLGPTDQLVRQLLTKDNERAEQLLASRQKDKPTKVRVRQQDLEISH